MTPFDLFAWAWAVTGCGVGAFVLYVLALFGVKLTKNYIATSKEPPVPAELFPLNPPVNSTVGPIQRPPGMPAANQAPMWPAQR